MMRVAPITAFVGANGSGKTLAAHAWAYDAHQRLGRRVLSNVPSFAERYSTLRELLEDPTHLQDTDVIVDEIGVMFASRRSTFAEFESLVQQLRKTNTRLWWTAPAYGRADKILREVTQMVVKCRGVVKIGEVWPQPKMIACAAFDANDFDTMGVRVSQNARREGQRMLKVKKYGHLFDTMHRVGLDQAPALAVVPDAVEADA